VEHVMQKPGLSWIPVRLINDIMVNKTLAIEECLDLAKNKFKLSAIEIHFGMLKNYQSDYLHLIHDKLRGLNLEVSQLCTSTDFTHPDPTERVHQKELLKNFNWAGTSQCKERRWNRLDCARS
jgi:hypothetical protein